MSQCDAGDLRNDNSPQRDQSTRSARRSGRWVALRLSRAFARQRTADESLDDRLLRLVVDAHHPERARLTLVVDAQGRDRPAPHHLARDQGLFRTLKLIANELVDDREDAVAESLAAMALRSAR